MAEGIISEYAVVDGVFTRKDTQDVDPILDENDDQRNSGLNDNRFASARKVASVPLVVLEALKQRSDADGGPIDINLVGSNPDHTARFVRWLDDRSNVRFRTSNSRMGSSVRYQ